MLLLLISFSVFSFSFRTNMINKISVKKKNNSFA